MPLTFPDYHAEAPGGAQGGRSMVTRPFDAHELGPHLKDLGSPLPELTVFDNIRISVESASGHRLSWWISSAEKAQIHQRVEDILKQTGLEANIDRLVGELAHGHQRAAEIAMAIALRPHLLLLDEPTAGMGDQETYEITKLIRRLHREANYTIVLIEHDMRVVFNLADRISVLDQGSMLAEGTPQEIASNEQVQAAYLGQAA